MNQKNSRAKLGGKSHATIHGLAVAIALGLIAATPAFAQTAPVATTASEAADAKPQADRVTLETVRVTARKREEALVDVPLSISAIDQESMERSGLHSVADVAPYLPGLNINSDSVGRAFISIRGIGTALQAGVQPGVGIFLDGIYMPETSYINNPLLDIERIEVLRGPQGTLYGKNTLGGAINIVPRTPPKSLEGKVFANYAQGDGNREFGAALGGPLAGENLRAKLAVSSRDTDGFFRNRLTGGRADATSSSQANLSVVWDAGKNVFFTGNAYYLDFAGGNTNYSHVDGPNDYRDNIRLNVTGRQAFIYKGANAKLEFPLGSDTMVTAIAAYDARSHTSLGDGDFLALDVVRARGDGNRRTATTEWRFDTRISDQLSTLFGLFASRDDVKGRSVQRVVGAGLDSMAYEQREGETYAAFGTAIWRFSDAWELSAGARLDRERRHQDTSAEISLMPGVVTHNPRQKLSSSQLQPRVSLTRFFDSGWMAYGSVAKGYRGGGFNAASVPQQFASYTGDTVWTYELGGKFASHDGRWFWSNAAYYNDYRDFIGQNALTRGPGGGLVSIDLNLGKVKSYGLESELMTRVTSNWTVRGSVALMHARITNQDGWIRVTGAPLASDRLLFQPDWNVSLSSELTVPVGAGAVDWSVGVVGKGSRPGSSFDPVTPSILSPYYVANTTLSYRQGPLTVGLYANNLFDRRYFESYIDGSLLSALGLLDQNLGILGAPRNVGIRLQYAFR